MIRVFYAITCATVPKLPSHRLFPHMKNKRMHVVTNIPQPTYMAIFNELINSQKFCDINAWDFSLFSQL